MTDGQKRAITTGVVTLILGTVVLAAAGQVVLRPEFARLQEDVSDIKYLICLDSSRATDSKCRP